MKLSSRTDFRRLSLTGYEKRRYSLPEERDFEILFKAKALERKKLDPEDKRIINLILTQLEKDWRKPLVKELDRLDRKYSKI